MRAMIILLPAMCLIACGPDHSQAPAPASIPYAEPGASLKITPPDAPDCGPSTKYIATVSWQVPDSASSELELQILDGGRKVFLRTSDRRGSERTEQWVRAGMTFSLIDITQNRVLAATRAGPDCANLKQPG